LRIRHELFQLCNKGVPILCRQGMRSARAASIGAMWFGLLHLPDTTNGTGKVILCAYEPDRIFTVGTSPEMAPQLLRMLHQAACETGGVEEPACPACGEPLELAPLDRPEAPCGSP
jgi:hypothetical protein